MQWTGTHFFLQDQFILLKTYIMCIVAFGLHMAPSFCMLLHAEWGTLRRCFPLQGERHNVPTCQTRLSLFLPSDTNEKVLLSEVWINVLKLIYDRDRRRQAKKKAKKDRIHNQSFRCSTHLAHTTFCPRFVCHRQNTKMGNTRMLCSP